MFKSKTKKTSSELGAKVVEAIRDIYSEFFDCRVFKLQSVIADIFARNLDKSIEDHGIDPVIIRQKIVEMNTAWLAGLMDMKPELLEFRDMQDWLGCAEVMGA